MFNFIGSEKELVSQPKPTCEENILSVYKIPIHYDGNKKRLHNSIIEDLELNTSVYNTICNNKSSKIYNTFIRVLSEYYTNDKVFLKDTQKTVELMKSKSNYCSLEKTDLIVSFLDDTINDEYFIEKYMYIDVECLSFLNENEMFMKVYSLVGISSPLFALLSPLFVLITPFVVLKLNNVEISYSMYIQILGDIIQSKVFGKVILTEEGVKNEDKIYAFFCVCLYIYHIYQNIQKCIKYYENINIIHKHIQELSDFLSSTIPMLKISLSERVYYKSDPHAIYYKEMETHLSVLEPLQELLLSIKPFGMDVNELLQLGILYKIFYTIYSDKTIHKSLHYALGYQGYMNILNELYKNVELKLLSNATYHKKSKKSDKKKKKHSFEFKDIVYPVLIKDTSNVTNNTLLDKNIILTGVNASGKTTMLKSIFINIILSQQIGIGSFSSFSFEPYDYLHCYINIIDTSDRYSLFQSECKKCQEIIQSIEENPNKKHFCVFDEIFSGTTPDEAVKCGYGFLTFLNSNPNIRFILTTHFMDLCKKLTDDNIVNYKMVSTIEDKTLLHTYKLEKGVNDIKGSVEILRQLNFPEEVITTISSL
jgi:hypothetical protein